MLDSVQPTLIQNVYQSILLVNNISSMIKTASYCARYLSVLGDRELHELQQVAGCVEEGKSGRALWRGTGVDLPEDKKQH